MTLIILWCFILASAKIVFAYDSHMHSYAIYPRLDLTCLTNSSFSFEFQIVPSNQSILNNNNSTRLLVYQHENKNTQKYFLIKLNSFKKLIFSDHWNINKQIPIVLQSHVWYKFVYKRKSPIGTSEINVFEVSNSELLYKDELTSDLSAFGHSLDYTQLFVGNTPNGDSLPADEFQEQIQAFDGKIRNLIYSHDLTLTLTQNKCACEQLPLRQYALFYVLKDTFSNKKRVHTTYADTCDAHKCATTNCLCLNTDNSNFKCDCLDYLSVCSGFTDNLKSFKLDFNQLSLLQEKESFEFSFLPKTSKMNINAKSVDWTSNGIRFRKSSSQLDITQAEDAPLNVQDACFWDLNACDNGFSQTMELSIDRIDFNRNTNDKLIIFRNGHPKKLMLHAYIQSNKIYFSFVDNVLNQEWLVSASLTSRTLYLSLNWLPSIKYLSLHLNGLLSDLCTKPLFSKGSTQLTNAGFVYQIGSNKLYHFFSLKFIQRDYLNNQTSQGRLISNDFDGYSSCIRLIHIENLLNLSSENRALVNSVANLDELSHGFYLSFKFRIDLSSSISSTHRILHTPNLILSWIPKLKSLEFVLKLHESYYYTHRLAQIKRNQSYLFEISLKNDDLNNRTLSVYLNRKLKYETHKYSYFDANIYEFSSDSSFTIGPIASNQFMSIDFLKLFNCSIEKAHKNEIFEFNGQTKNYVLNGNVELVSDLDLIDGKNVLYFDGNKKFAKLNLQSSPSTDARSFKLIFHMKLITLNRDHMYFVNGYGLEIFTLSKELIIKYQHENKQWLVHLPQIKSNKWYLFSINWSMHGGLYAYVNNELAGDDTQASLVDHQNYYNIKELYLGRPPTQINAVYGQFYVDYLIYTLLDDEEESQSEAVAAALDSRVLVSSPLPSEIIKIDNTQRVMYKIESHIQNVQSESIELSFRTQQSDSIVFYIRNNPIITYLELINGKPYLQIDTRYNNIRLTPQKCYALNDNKWHEIKLLREHHTISIQIDGQFYDSSSNLLSIENQNILNSGYVYLGISDPNNINLSNKKAFVGEMIRGKVVINNIQQKVSQQPYVASSVSGNLHKIIAQNQTVNIDTSQIAHDGKTINIVINVYGPPGSQQTQQQQVITQQQQSAQDETHVIYLDTLPNVQYLSLAPNQQEILISKKTVLQNFHMKLQTRAQHGQILLFDGLDRNYIGIEMYDGFLYTVCSHGSSRQRYKLSPTRVDTGQIFDFSIKQELDSIVCYLNNNEKQLLIKNSPSFLVNYVRIGGTSREYYDFYSESSFVGCLGSLILNEYDLCDDYRPQNQHVPQQQSCANVIRPPIIPTPPPAVPTTTPRRTDFSLGYISFDRSQDEISFTYSYEYEKINFEDISFIFRTQSENGILFTAHNQDNYNPIMLGAYLKDGYVHVAYLNVTITLDLVFNHNQINDGNLYRLNIRRNQNGQSLMQLQSYTYIKTLDFYTQSSDMKLSRIIIGGTDEWARVKFFGTKSDFSGCILDLFQINGNNIIKPSEIPKERYSCTVETTVTHEETQIKSTHAPNIQLNQCNNHCTASKCLLDFNGKGYLLYKMTSNRVNDVYYYTIRTRNSIQFYFKTSYIQNDQHLVYITQQHSYESLRIIVKQSGQLVAQLNNRLFALSSSSHKYNDNKWHHLLIEKNHDQILIVTIDGQIKEYLNDYILNIDLCNDNNLIYFATSTPNSLAYSFNGELREIIIKYGNNDYDLIGLIRSQPHVVSCSGYLTIKPYLEQDQIKCIVSNSNDQSSSASINECYTDGVCYTALRRNPNGIVDKYQKCFNRNELEPLDNPFVCQSKDETNYAITCCNTNMCNRDLNVRLKEPEVLNGNTGEGGKWYFKGDNLGCLRYSFDLTRQNDPSKLTLSINTSQSESTLFYIKSTQLDIVLVKLELRSGRAQLTCDNGKRRLNRVECKTQFNDNKMHKIEISKQNRYISLSCDGDNQQSITTDNDQPLLSSNNFIIFGCDLDSKAKGFIGDLTSIQYNDKNLNDLNYLMDDSLIYNGYLEYYPLVQMDTHTSTHPKPIRFRHGASSIVLSKWNELKLGRISFEFKLDSNSLNGLLFSLTNKNGYFAVLINNGYLEALLNDKYQRLFPQPYSHSLNDQKWHKFEFRLLDANLIASIILDEDYESKIKFNPLVDNYWSDNMNLIFGENSQISSPSVDLNSFIGCMKNVIVNNKLIDWSAKGSLFNIESGCYDSQYVSTTVTPIQSSMALIFHKSACLKFNSHASTSNHESIEFLFKTTQDKAILLSTNDLTLSTHGPALLLKTVEHEKILLEHGVSYLDGNWHQVKLIKSGDRLTVELDDRLKKSLTLSIGQLSQFNMACSNFRGHIANLFFSINDRNKINIIDELGKTNSNRLKLEGIVSWISGDQQVQQTSQSSSQLITLQETTSFVQMDRIDFSSDVSFSFKTSDNSSLVFALFTSTQNFIAFEMADGKLFAILNENRIECENGEYSDNRWHAIEIRHTSDYIHLMCDNFNTRISLSELSQIRQQGQIIIGNIPTLKLPWQLWTSSMPRFTGCIKDFSIHKKSIDLYQLATQQSRATLTRGKCDTPSSALVSMDLPLHTISLNGSYSLEYEISGTHGHLFSSEQLGLRFKTRLRNGVLATLKKSSSSRPSLIVSLEDGRLKLNYECQVGNKLVYIGEYGSLNNNKWNTLIIRRYGERVIVEVLDSERQRLLIEDNLVFLAHTCDTLDYDRIIIGSSGTNDHLNFIGWIQNLNFNNHDLLSSYIKGTPSGAYRFSNGYADIGENSLLLHHLVNFKEQSCSFSLNGFTQGDKWMIHFLFKTQQSNGLLFFSKHPKQSNKNLLLELKNGYLRFTLNTGGSDEPKTLKSEAILNDKSWHEISIRKWDKHKYSIKIDDSRETFTETTQTLNELGPFLFAGDFSSNHQEIQGYTGCMASLEINGEVVDLLAEASTKCPTLKYGCSDFSCDTNPCMNNGECMVESNQLTCNCDMTSYTGPYCRDDSKFYYFGQKCGLIKYNLQSVLNKPQETDKFAFGFSTNQPDGTLVSMKNELNPNEITLIKLVDGYLHVSVQINDEKINKVYALNEPLNDNKYHVFQMFRSGNVLYFKVDNYIEDQIVINRHELKLYNMNNILVGSVYASSSSQLQQCFLGHLSGMVFNTYRVLDYGVLIGDVKLASRPVTNLIHNITTIILADGTCSLGYTSNGYACLYVGCPRYSEYQTNHSCACYYGYFQINNECVEQPIEIPKDKIIEQTTKLILVPAKAQTPIGLILGIISAILLGILGAAIAARKCADGGCLRPKAYTKVPVHIGEQKETGKELEIERRDFMYMKESSMNQHDESSYHKEEMVNNDVLDFGYNEQQQQQQMGPIITQSVNETMEMFEQTLGGVAGGGVHSASGGQNYHQSSHHASSQRDLLAMDSLIYNQNSNEYELSNVTCVTMTPNGKYAIIGQTIGLPQIWDTTNGQLIRTMSGTCCNNCTNLQLACNGTVLIGLSNDMATQSCALNLCLWEIQTGRPIQMTHQIKCHTFCTSHDTQSIFMAGNQRYGRGVSVGILDLVSNELVKEIKSDPNIAFGDCPESIMVTSDEKHAIVGCRSQSGTNFVVFDLTKSTEIAQTRSISLDADPKCIQILNNNEILVGTKGGHLIQWNIHSCKPTFTYEDESNRAHSDSINQILLSTNKELLASASNDCTAKVWNTQTKQLVSVLSGHYAEVSSISFSHHPNNDLIITGSNDQTVGLWKLFSGQQVSSMNVGMNLLEVYMAKHNKTIVAIGEKDGEQQLLLLRVVNVHK